LHIAGNLSRRFGHPAAKWKRHRPATHSGPIQGPPLSVVAGPMTPGMSPMARRASGLEVLHLVLGAWSFVVTLKCLGEVHRFSAWRALGSIVVLILAIAVVIFVLIMAGVSIGRLMHPATTI
jgi:hypothetical protein